MKPTNKLRFVERNLGYTKVRVLQQWWEDSVGDIEQGITAFGEWRDVPLEKEQ